MNDFSTRMGSQGHHDDDMVIDLAQLWQALMRRKWLILAFIVVAAVAAYGASDMMTPIYKASTTVIVQTSGPAGLAGLLDRSLGTSPQTDLQRATEILKSRSLALQTARALGHDWDEHSSELTRFRNIISVQANAQANMLTVSVEHEDRTEAWRIANTVVATFIDMTRALKNEDVRQAREFVGEQLKLFEGNLAQAEDALLEYRLSATLHAAEVADGGDNENNMRFAGSTEAVIDQIIVLEKARAEAWVEKQTAEQHLNAMSGRWSDDYRSVTSQAAVESDPTVQSIRSSLVRLETDLAGARERYTERHPVILGLKAQIDELNKELTNAIGRLQVEKAGMIVSSDNMELQAKVLAAQAKIDAIDALIAERELQLGGLPEKELQLKRLMRDAAVQETIYMTLLRRYEEMRITEAMESADASVLDPAIVPSQPIRPRKMLNVAIATFLGAFLGVGMALLLEYMDKSFRDVEDVENLLGLPVVGRIPTFSENRERPSKQRKAG